jgi:hypothetical protein
MTSILRLLYRSKFLPLLDQLLLAGPARNLLNMYIFTTVVKFLLVGMSSVYGAVIEDEQRTFPDILPGPNMPSLASMGMTSASLYTQAHALLSKF